MGRHEAELPLRRRVLAAVLGSSTLLLLLVTIWMLSRGSGAETPGDMVDTTSSTTPTSTVPPTSSTTTIPSTTFTTTATSTTATSTTAVASTATTEPPTTTTTLASLSLEADGLGPVRFGLDPEEALAEVEARLGPPTSDSGWVSARGNFGTCPGSIVRVVRWESLRLFFTDGPTDFGQDETHFFYYVQSSAEAEVVLTIRTEAGIGIGSTVAQLRDAYGNRLDIESSSPFGVTFTIDTVGRGLLSGTLTQSVPEGQVTSLAGGYGCGA